MNDAEGRRLDGNAAGGPLAELFAIEVTMLQVTCASCGAAAPLGAHLLYADAPALVLRCPSCGGVVLRYSNAGDRLRLDISGVTFMEGSPSGTS
jgi:NAD-dependent SIR2 family protein deacetylase